MLLQIEWFSYCVDKEDTDKPLNLFQLYRQKLFEGW